MDDFDSTESGTDITGQRRTDKRAMERFNLGNCLDIWTMKNSTRFTGYSEVSLFLRNNPC